MSYLTNGGMFRIERHPENETPGNPFDYTLTVQEHGAQRLTLTGLTKGDLTEFRKRLNQAIKEQIE